MLSCVHFPVCIEHCASCSGANVCETCDDGYCFDTTEIACHCMLTVSGIQIVSLFSPFQYALCIVLPVNGRTKCDFCEKIGNEVSCLTCGLGTFLELCQGITHFF